MEHGLKVLILVVTLVVALFIFYLREQIYTAA